MAMSPIPTSVGRKLRLALHSRLRGDPCPAPPKPSHCCKLPVGLAAHFISSFAWLWLGFANAETLDEIAGKEDRVFWKIYAIIACVLFALGSVGSLFDPSFRYNAADYLDIAITATVFIGFVAFAYRRRLISRSFWRVVLVFLIAWSIYYQFLPAPDDMRQKISEVESWVATVSYYAFMTPIVIGIWKYSSKNSPVWIGKEHEAFVR